MFSCRTAASLLANFLCVALLRSACAAPPPTPPDGSRVLDTLDRSHPRLLLKNAELEAMKRRRATDAVLDRYVKSMLAGADKTLARKKLMHELKGPRLLDVSRDCLNRVVTQALAWRWTGDDKYARAAVDNMLTVAAFPDWNPKHFLDVAEMTNALGVGYDWLFDYMDEAARGKVRTAIIELGLKEGIKVYDKGGWWTTGINNWNQVCNGGMLVGALAIAETNPEYARRIVPAAVKALPHALASYAPDGAWFEGPGYWHYATRYVAWGLGALDSALGTDFGLSKMDGMAGTGLFPIYTCGPSEMFLNFADAGVGKRGALPCQFWLARKYGQTFLSDSEHFFLQNRPAAEEHVMWYVPPSGKPFSPPDLDHKFDGKVPVMVFRGAWGDPNALWVGVKAGYNQAPHGHLDLGNFELDALGVRWAMDLGSDNYNLPGYWNGKRGGTRWQYYRLNSLSHNVPALDNKIQDPEGKAQVLRFESGPLGGFAAIDLSSAYAPLGRKVLRGVRMLPGRRAVLVQDEFDLTTPSEIAWGMTTKAAIQPDGARAILSMNRARLEARILEPAGAAFSVESAEQKEPQATNKGVRRLMVRLARGGLQARIAILLTPLAAGMDASGEAPAVRSLAEWNLATGAETFLKSLTVAGQPLEGFDPKNFTYHVTLPAGSTGIPEVAAQADAAARVEVVRGGDTLPGSVSVVVRDAKTGEANMTYQVFFKTDRSAGVGLGQYEKLDGIQVAASSFQDGNPPSGAMDRKMETRWSAEGKGEMLQFDLGSERVLDHVAMAYFMGDERVSFFAIQLSSDGKAWETVFDGKSSGATLDLEKYDAGGRKARYVRIEGKGNSQSDWNSITEVAFGFRK